MAAGGIVLQWGDTPLIAVVRLRKRNEWVLPKGKLNDGETALAAAEREVLEETGHSVLVHEFLGMLAYDAGGRSKVVHFWRMEAGDQPTHELMNDVKAVDWLPLDEAVARLTRGYEQAFLAQIGPIALQAAARQASPTPAARRRRRPAIAKSTKRPVAVEALPAPASEIMPTPITPTPGGEPPIVAAVMPVETFDADSDLLPETPNLIERDAPALAPEACSHDVATQPPEDAAAGLLQRIRRWLLPKA
jgi:8-oxo-dGTP diphosphatase